MQQLFAEVFVFGIAAYIFGSTAWRDLPKTYSKSGKKRTFRKRWKRADGSVRAQLIVGFGSGVIALSALLRLLLEAAI